MDIKRDLLRTKLYIPPSRDGIVARPQLRQRLDDGLRQGAPLTLVSAPAGYGKTNLIAAWLRQRETQQSFPQPMSPDCLPLYPRFDHSSFFTPPLCYHPG